MDTRKVIVDYIKAFDTKDKERLKVMLSHGIVCGAGFANEHGIDVTLFNKELKSILEENNV